MTIIRTDHEGRVTPEGKAQLDYIDSQTTAQQKQVQRAARLVAWAAAALAETADTAAAEDALYDAGERLSQDVLVLKRAAHNRMTERHT